MAGKPRGLVPGLARPGPGYVCMLICSFSRANPALWRLLKLSLSA